MRFISNIVRFLRICAFAAAVPYLLRLKLSRVVGALEPGKDPWAVDENRVRKITTYVEKAIRRGKPMVRPGCLTRGLTRYYFLRRAGMDVALCFGMGRLDNEFGIKPGGGGPKISSSNVIMSGCASFSTVPIDSFATVLVCRGQQ